jgi:hypothetical protein
MTAASTPSPAVETTAADERAEKSATAARSGIRPMARADIPAVERIFCTAFAKQGASDDLGAYIEALFFDNPHYSDENGSIVYEDAKKGVTSAIFSLPIPFEVHGRPVMARLLCAFMSDGTKSGALGAGRITRSLRADQVEFCFTDNASPVSASHWATGGGVALPVESLEWRRAFQPLGAALHDLRGRRGWRLLRLLAAPPRRRPSSTIAAR